jgi:hypothetical protein
MFGISKTMLGTMGAILATGAVLNLAGSGKLGKLPQQFAQFVTKGYGV